MNTKTNADAAPVPNGTLLLPQLGHRWEVLAIILTVVVVAAVAFFAGYTTGTGAGAAASAQPGGDEFAVFWEAWNYVENEFYYDKPSTTERVYAAIRGMLSSLGDDYTAFVQPSLAEVDRQNLDGEFGGIGAYVQLNAAGQMVIASPFPDQPAANAGLQSGDVVLSIDGQTVANLSLAEGTALIRGPLGTEVALEIYRPSTDASFEVSVERARIEVPTVRSDMLDGNVAYVSLARFNGVATLQLEDALRTLLAQNPRALIFDLRGNLGGLLDEAVSVGDLFLSQGLIATQRTSLSQEPRVFYADSGDIAEDIPLIVLVDQASASASEIVAGAIKDRHRGVLIGTRTFGKGSVQLVHDLSDGSSLRITYGAWYTPDEDDMKGVGLQPDIEVEIPADQSTLDADPWLQAALDYIDTTYPQTQ